MSRVTTLNPTDARLVGALEHEPRASVMLLAERLGLSRNTVHARLTKLEAAGTLGAARGVMLATFGYPVTAFVTFATTQGQLTAVVRALADVPEVVEAFATTGDGDLLCRVVAPDTEALFDLVQLLLRIAGIERSNTTLALRELLPWRITPLLERLTETHVAPSPRNSSG